MASDLEERVRAAIQEKLTMMKIPEKENDFLPSSCCLLEKQRELAEVEKTFSATKEDFQKKMDHLQQRRQELERKEGQLKQAILKFDKFLKENDAKRSRAMRKAEQEKQQMAHKKVEAERLQEEIARLTTAKTRLQGRLAAHKPFCEYLQEVLGKTEQFQDISELIGRFETLRATQVSLVRREQVAREAVEEERSRLQQYLDESSNRILQQNNMVAELQDQLEQTQGKVLELESNWICIQNTAASKTLELGQIKLAALNLFQMVIKHRKLPMNVPQEDTDAQLDAVQLCVEDLTAILADFRKAEPPQPSQPEKRVPSQASTSASRSLLSKVRIAPTTSSVTCTTDLLILGKIKLSNGIVL
ncbi:cilia- and flagella-associated protein 73 [Notechis scutatus]|uniref:Cilia- and flagella-associated protein 73 n=1 Tax=Notechis scutatus TaxID=8663 RepID=A0A6J1VB16_9SAUR|nr:cilia- and flagella-associated protein 73 [Notechis scutatus]